MGQGVWNGSGVHSDECAQVHDTWNAPPPPPPPGEEIQHNGSPIVLDIGHDGYRFTSVSDGVRFDLRNEGQKLQMAWTRAGAENAFLALDRNGNHHIDNGAELFGNYTPLRSGALAENGFVALAELDENGDGIVSAADAAWPSLLLWVDRNHDGLSAPGELQPVASSVVTALATDSKWTGRRDEWGNLFRFNARFWIQSGTRQHQRKAYDVFFRLEP